MKEGGDVRMKEEERVIDGKNKTGGRAERQIGNKKRRQRRNFKTRRWRKGGIKSGACRGTKKSDKTAANTIHGQGKIKSLEQRGGS